MKILIVGDVHGNWPELNNLLNKKRPDLVLQAGDFGYFPDEKDKFGFHRYDPSLFVKTGGAPLHWCPGNHEDHKALRKLEAKHGLAKPIEVGENLFYQPRGSILTLPDDRNVLFMGGAFSVDWGMRDDWCGDLELLHQEDLDRVPDVSIDIAISHTAPREFRMNKGQWHPEWDPTSDPSQDVLSRLLQKRKPKRWFFGHFHTFLEGEKYEGCKWTALGYLRAGQRPWFWLEG